MEIKRLDDTHFEEYCLKEIKPFDKIWSDGVHTVAHVEHVTLIDCRKWSWSASYAIRKIRRKITNQFLRRGALCNEEPFL